MYMQNSEECIYLVSTIYILYRHSMHSALSHSLIIYSYMLQLYKTNVSITQLIVKAQQEKKT